MQELEEAERYAAAALFTPALHSTAASAERYARDDWGEDDELYRHHLVHVSVCNHDTEYK